MNFLGDERNASGPNKFRGQGNTEISKGVNKFINGVIENQKVGVTGKQQI